MPSRLSSLLVRDGLVGVKRMEKAFQRQVIYGGSLDTILLEMNLVPEERLTQYLALASGLPPASRDDGASVDPAVAVLIAHELAERYRAVPVAAEGEAVRILVCAPLELSELEDLADQLDRPLQPLITPEYRWHLVFAAIYGMDPPARFTTLARSLDVDPTSTPVGRARTVIVEGAPAGPIPIASDQTERSEAPIHIAQPVLPVAPALSDDATLRMMTVEPPIDAAADEPGRSRKMTLIGVAPPSRASVDESNRKAGVTMLAGPRAASGPIPAVSRPSDPRLADGSAPVGGGVPVAGGVAAGRASSGGVSSGGVSSGGVSSGGVSSGGVSSGGVSSGGVSSGGARPSASRPVKRAPTAAIITEGRDSPIPVVRARELLATADDRDTVFLTLLRAARSRARWAGLLTVQGGAAIGRVALAEPGLDTVAVGTILIPLDSFSPFRTVISNQQPHIGPLLSGDPGIDAMVLRMGGTMPPSGLILPVVLRDRVVAVVVAHRVHSDTRLVDVTELLPIATAASDALGRLIVKHKAAGYRAPTEATMVELEADLIDTKRVLRFDHGDSPWSAPERPSPPPSAFEQGVEMSIDADPPRPIDELIAVIEAAGEGEAEDAMTEAVDRFGDTLGALMRRFPGKLRVDRFAVTGRALRAAQYGGLLELVIRLGPVASELLIDKMSAPQRDVRYYATLCVAELRPRTAVYALAERLFDQDFGVRGCAIEALAGYQANELGHALVRARRAVHSSDPEVVGAATAAIIELGDIDAIPDLIAGVERSDRASEHARKGLVALTAQDFGPSEKKWRKWYEAARARHRIEWLIEGLGHREDAIRERAINDLRRLTGEYFGYHHDLAKRERELAADRWAAWWRDAGRRRFATPENERNRPTGLLPLRRDPP